MRMKLIGLCLLLALASFACAAGDSASVVVSLVNQNPDPAGAGETAELRFMVENRGGKDVRDLGVELALGYPFSRVPGEEYTKTVGSLSAYQQGADASILKYRVAVDKDAVRGSHNVTVVVHRADLGSSVTKEYAVDVSGEEFAQIKYINRAKLDRGKETELQFTVVNVGNAPLKNLIFSWDEGSGAILPVYSDDTQYVSYLDVGKAVDINYTVVADVNAQAGLYQLDLSLKFEIEGATTSELNTKAGVFVGGETDFEVTFSESSAGQTSLSVANTGNNPALSVAVKIPQQEAYTVSGSTSSIIGNLDKGDYTIVSFQIVSRTGGTRPNLTRAGTTPSPEEMQNMRTQWAQRGAAQGTGGAPTGAQPGAAGTGGAGAGAQPGAAGGTGTFAGAPPGALKVQIDYTDTAGVRHTIEKSVPIQFRTADAAGATARANGTQTAGAQTNYLVWGAGIAVLLLGGWLKRDLVRAYVRRLMPKRKD